MRGEGSEILQLVGLSLSYTYSLSFCCLVASRARGVKCGVGAPDWRHHVLGGYGECEVARPDSICPTRGRHPES